MSTRIANCRRWTFVAAGLLAATSGTALYYVIAGGVAEYRVEAELTRLTALHPGSVSVDPWNGSIVVSRLTGKIAGATVSIGRAVLPGTPVPPLFIAPARAASGTAHVENIDIDTGAGKTHIPRIDVRGTDLTSRTLAEIVDEKSHMSFVERVAQFSAEDVSIPQVSVDVSTPGATQRFVYDDIRLEHIVKGRIAQYSAGRASLSMKFDGAAAELGTIDAIFGKSTVKNYDVGLYARVAATSRKDPHEALAPLWDSVVIDGVRIEGKSFAIKTGQWTSGKFMIRPFETTPSQFQRSLVNASGAKPNPEEIAKTSTKLMSEMYENTAFGAIEVKDVVATIGDGDNASSVKIGSMGARDFANARVGEMALDGFDLEAPGTMVKFDVFAMRGFDFKATLGALKSIQFDKPETIGSFNPRSFLPSLDQILFTGFDAEVPDEHHGGNVKGGKANKFKIGKVDIKASNYRQGIPTALAMSVEHVALDLPPPRDANARQFAAMGYTSADMTAKFVYAWNEAASTLTLSDASLTGVGMGLVSLKAEFGNIGSDLFVGDAAIMQAAALSGTIAKADVRIENDGLFTRVFELRAKQAGVTVERFREANIENARATLSQLLGTSSQANAVVEALVAFIKDPKSIEIIAKSAKGLRATDLPLLQNPPELIKLLDIQSIANR